jgi:hypothetical protein
MSGIFPAWVAPIRAATAVFISLLNSKKHMKTAVAALIGATQAGKIPLIKRELTQDMVTG